MAERKYVNILLLGETGTGKSTLINALPNYLDYASLAEAENATSLKCIIPAKFSITTEDDDLKMIYFGESANEDTGVGNSSTQCAQTHKFDYGDRIIRIIDTPGINDSRGAAAKDQENLENIMHCLEQYEELHAVCFLLKPDVTVITPAFKYCLLELLSRLNCSAAENIIFVFTRTKGTDYGAPDSLICLRQLVDEIAKQGISVPLRHKLSERRNCYFVDNEGFKYFVARAQGFRMKNEAGLKASWEISKQACRDMIEYILGDADHAPLSPHRVRDTVCVSKARQLIDELCHPLKDVNQHVHEALDSIRTQRAELQRENLTADELRRRLRVKRPVLRCIELNHPVTVCSSRHCTEIIKVGDIEQRHYKQKCHDPCELPFEAINQVPIIGNVQLWAYCEAINWYGACKVCECHVASHITIYYETQPDEELVEDFGVKADLSTQTGVIEAKNRALAALQTHHDDLQEQREEIGTAMAMFAHFNRTNSMCPINDAYEEYLDVLIKNENKGGLSSEELLERYKRMKEDHIKHKATLAQCESDARKRNIRCVTADQVLETYERLKGMSYTGKALAQMHAKVVECHAKMKRCPPKKTKNELSAEIDDGFSRGVGTGELMELIHQFVQNAQGGMLRRGIRTVGNALSSVLGQTVEGVSERYLASNPSDLWRNIKGTNDPTEMLKMCEHFSNWRK